ncbi:MAG: PilC/PilY family type IV pilus protein [Burkholderiaceae bacterium]
MKQPSIVRRSARLLARLALPLAFCAASVASADSLDLADKPLFSTTSVPGNLLLSLSVEFPTANSQAYFSTAAYAATTAYLGYFDGDKCYKYLYGPDQSPATSADLSYFQAYSVASSHTCTSSSSLHLWSGNYLNYASMLSLDIFRWVLTGGNRITDTSGSSGMTILQRGIHSGQGGANDAPNKTITTLITGATPLGSSGSWTNGMTTRIWGAGTKMWFTNSYNLNNTAVTATDYKDSAFSTIQSAPTAAYALYMNVRVCDTTVNVESNCVLYGSNKYKPEGLLQQYSGSLRYGAFGYINDGIQKRDGGVLRARMAYIGPTFPVPGAADQNNTQPEWDPSTGVMNTNPDPADATSNSAISAAGITQSGVMNYLNKFGYTSNIYDSTNAYKKYDPVSELYYASLRYLKGQDNVSAYTSVTGATGNTLKTFVDGFPVITNWSSDPVIYACQKNFILGIGDVNTNQDADLPGSTLYASGIEPAIPSEVTADTSIGTNLHGQATAAVNVATTTNLVGTMENAANTTLASTWENSGGKSTYYMAGLAYDAHIPIEGHGLRTFTDVSTGVKTVSTVSTYWLDVQEYQAYVNNNLYYYATKFGGFTVPKNYVYGTAPTLDSWYTSTNVQGSNKQPDNYFTASNATQMKAGLTNAFAKIVAENDVANGTALSVPTPNVTSTGAMSYSATYDPASWTGQVIGSTIAFALDGTPSLTPQWDARALLSATTVTAATRKIVTCCTTSSSAPGLPFTATALIGPTLNSRTYVTSFASVPGATSQSSANYIAYLRGDTSKEIANGGAYRNRSFRLGDIVNAKPVTVGPPSYQFFDTYNAGYSAFRALYATRKDVVYAGSNDGMLHAFDGTVGNTSPISGSELFAYIPSFAYGTSATASTSGLASLGNPSFTHHYLVDGTPGQFDVDLNKTSGATGSPDWHTLLIGGLGKGGNGYYALDVTDPTSWSDETTIASKVKWEFTDSRLGYTYGTPTVVKTKKYGWVVVFTSGYANSDGMGYFFFVNPVNGTLLEVVSTPSASGSTSSPLNLGQQSAYVENYTDMTADAIYAGDLQGNVWRVNVSATDTTLPYPTATKIAQFGSSQPISTRPLIEISTNSNTRYVMVGTGKLLADSDIATSNQQSFYAIADGIKTSGAFYGSASQPLPSGVSFPITRSALNVNTSLLTGIGSSPSSVMGWYFDLPVTSGIAQRVNVDAFANQGIVAFIGNLPNGSACDPHGTGTVYGVDFASGKTVLLTSDTGVATASTAISGVGTDVTVISVDGNLHIYTGGSKGVVAKAPASLTTSAGVTQINWRDVPATN